MQSRDAAVGRVEHGVAYPELALARDETCLGIELELRESSTHGGNCSRHVRVAGSGTRLVVEEDESFQPARVGRLQLAQRGESDPSRSQSLEQRGEGVDICVRDVELEQRLASQQKFAVHNQLDDVTAYGRLTSVDDVADLETQLDPQQMTDLMAFIRGGR